MSTRQKRDFISQPGVGKRKVNTRIFLELGIVAGAFVLSCFSLLATRVMAQDVYPAKDITFICHSNPGGAFDIAARGMAPLLSKYLREVSPNAKGGDVKVKNMPGASGAKACTYLHDVAKPDGYTIGDFNRGNLYNFLYGSEKLPFDVRNLSWLFSPTEVIRILICNKKRFATWEEMIASSKKEPLSFVTSIIGGSEHIEAVYFKEKVGLSGKFTATGGAAMAVSAIIRGDGDICVIAYDSVKAMADSKEVTVLVTFTEERLFPQVPTIKEKGVPDLLKYVGGKGGKTIVGPPNLSPEARRILVAAARKMIADPEYQAYCNKVGAKLGPLFEKELQEELMRQVKIQVEWSPILKKYGL